MGVTKKIVLRAGILTLGVRYLLVLNRGGKMLLPLRGNYCWYTYSDNCQISQKSLGFSVRVSHSWGAGSVSKAVRGMSTRTWVLDARTHVKSKSKTMTTTDPELACNGSTGLQRPVDLGFTGPASSFILVTDAVSVVDKWLALTPCLQVYLHPPPPSLLEDV